MSLWLSQSACHKTFIIFHELRLISRPHSPGLARTDNANRAQSTHMAEVFSIFATFAKHLHFPNQAARSAAGGEGRLLLWIKRARQLWSVLCPQSPSVKGVACNAVNTHVNMANTCLTRLPHTRGLLAIDQAECEPSRRCGVHAVHAMTVGADAQLR
jgi:hypothetical protein